MQTLITTLIVSSFVPCLVVVDYPQIGGHLLIALIV